MELKNKTAIITGGASGIGRAIALRFARAGAAVVIADVSIDPVEGGSPTHDLIAGMGGCAQFVETDVTKSTDIDHLVTTTIKDHGRLDVLVNYAAIFSGTGLMETSGDHWDTVMRVNLKGVFLCAKRAVQQMLSQTIQAEVRGRIINLASQHGIQAAPSSIAYGTSKAGVAYMTKQIAYDYAKQHIVCNAIAPGKIVTGKPGRAASQAALDYSYAHTPMPRLGKPEDVANTALFLAGDTSTFMTGAVILVDGGWMTH
jgi:NAD(P)-dependent dehydrogenase (short-subunit alcohol dehydrogenase family)